VWTGAQTPKCLGTLREAIRGAGREEAEMDAVMRRSGARAAGRDEAEEMDAVMRRSVACTEGRTELCVVTLCDARMAKRGQYCNLNDTYHSVLCKTLIFSPYQMS
jgi:hypothetical protein